MATQSLNARLAPSAQQFVVRVRTQVDAMHIAARVAALGSAVPLAGHTDLLLVEVRLGAKYQKDSWQTLRACLGEAVVVLPVFLDSGGIVHYPTGEIVVRFKREVSDAALESFSREHNLQLCARNKFVRAQATFVPVALAEVYLPALLLELAADADVAAAWPSTLSVYERR